MLPCQKNEKYNIYVQRLSPGASSFISSMYSNAQSILTVFHLERSDIYACNCFSVNQANFCSSLQVVSIQLFVMRWHH